MRSFCSQFVLAFGDAVGADVGLVETLDLCARVMEPFLTHLALDVNKVRVHRHLANALLLPVLRRGQQGFLLMHVFCPAEVVVLVCLHQFAVLLLSHHEALALDGLNVQAEVEVLAGEDFCLRDVHAVLV